MNEHRKAVCEKLFYDFKNARQINRSNLSELLSDNSDTEYGKSNGFSQIPSAEEYAKCVPLTDYTAYSEKILSPEKFTVYPVCDMLATSGSTGKQKVFPLTEKALQRYSSYVHDMPYYLANTDEKALHVSVFRSPQNGLNILSSAYFRRLSESGYTDFDSLFVGGKILTVNDNIVNIPYVKAWLIFSYPDLCAIQSIYLYDIAMLFAWIEENYAALLSDMRNKKVSFEKDEEVKKALLANLPSEERLCELEKVLDKGFDEPIVPKLWKKIKFVCGVGGKMYSVQEKQLLRYIGGVPIYQFSYALSECIIALATEFGNAYYTMLPQSAYFEFLTKDGEIPTMLEDIEAGQIYELVISTFSGLYRYRTGDLIKIIRFDGQAPVFEIVGKRQQILDIAGEKLDSYTATEAMNRFAKKYGLETSDFAFGINTAVSPNGYNVFIETEHISEALGGEDDFDIILSKIAPDYADLRKIGLLSKVRIHTLPKHSISASAEKKLSHSKPQIFPKASQLAVLLEKSAEYEKR